MTRWVAVVAVTVAAPLTAQTPVFRSGVQSVIVGVSVQLAGKPVLGLTLGDFELLDRGVRQRIADVTFETFPVDVTLVLDVSLSVEGQLLQQLRDTVRRVAAATGPGDRLRLLTFSQRLRRLLDFGDRAEAVETATSALRAGGSTSAFDALAMAMIHAPDPGRRRLVVVFSDGHDTSSILDERTLTTVAARSDTAVYVVAGSRAQREIDVDDLPNGRLFARLSESTGGRLVQVWNDRPISDGFLAAVDEFRRSYVIRYTPTGVDPAGWHDLTVRITKPGRFDVRARRGYLGR